jgi:hypothetical protein
MSRHWITVVSGRGDKSHDKVLSAKELLEQEVGPLTEVEGHGSYAEQGGVKIAYESPTGLIASLAFDRAGFSTLSILDGSDKSIDLKGLSSKIRKGVGIKSPYKNRSKYKLTGSDYEDTHD